MSSQDNTFEPVESVDEAIRMWCNGEKRAEENTKLFRGQLHEIDKYDSCTDAIRRIVYDISWYSKYNTRIVTGVLEKSAYRRGEHFDSDLISDAMRDAHDDQNGGYYGDGSY
jgi:hypothetical protein